MGYSFGRTSSGHYALACDNCGVVGGVRKRKCPHTVLTDSIRSANGQRHRLPYCPAPAVCSPCLKQLGGSRKLHERCAEPAAKSQADYDAAEAIWLSGEPVVVSAIRTDDPTWTKVSFYRHRSDGSTEALTRYIPADDYHQVQGSRRTMRLSDFPLALADAPHCLHGRK